MLSKVKYSDPIYSILVKISIILFILFTGWLLYDHFINRPPEMRYYLSGNTDFKDKRYDTALENYLKAFSYNQSDVYIIEGIARSYMELNDYENSLKYFNLAIKTDEDRFRPEKSEVFELIASTERFRKIVNWEPKIKLEDGLKLTIDWWKNQIKDKKVRAYSSYSF